MIFSIYPILNLGKVIHYIHFAVMVKFSALASVWK